MAGARSEDSTSPPAISLTALNPLHYVSYRLQRCLHGVHFLRRIRRAVESIRDADRLTNGRGVSSVPSARKKCRDNIRRLPRVVPIHLQFVPQVGEFAHAYKFRYLKFIVFRQLCSGMFGILFPPCAAVFSF